MPKTFILKHDATLTYSDAAITSKPELAAMAMLAISVWSYTETIILRIFQTLLGPKEDLAFSLYLSIKAQGTQEVLIRKVAGMRMGCEDLKILNILLDNARKARTHRNFLAHCSWGLSDNHPECVILSSHEKTVTLEHEYRIEQIALIKKGKLEDIDKIFETYENRIIPATFVYSKDDLENIVTDIRKIRTLLSLFLFSLTFLNEKVKFKLDDQVRVQFYKLYDELRK